MRGFCEAEPAFLCNAIAHLLGMPHVTMERREAVNDAVNSHRRGLDFADTLHWTNSAAGNQFMSSDDRRFVRRARRLKLTPEVRLATNTRGIKLDDAYATRALYGKRRDVLSSSEQ